MENQDKNLFERIIEGFCESTKEAHEVQKMLTRKEIQAFIQRHKEATELDLGLIKVKEAKGVKAKVTQIIENLKEGCKTAGEKENKRRAEHDKKMSQVNPYIKAKQQVAKKNIA